MGIGLYGKLNSLYAIKHNSMLKNRKDIKETWVHYEQKPNGEHLLFNDRTEISTWTFFGIPVYRTERNYETGKPLPNFNAGKKSVGY